MISITIRCRHCQSEALVKNGNTRAGSQRAQCKDCGKTLAVEPKSRAVTPEKEALIERLLEERTTIRGICRAAKCGPQTVYAVLKKSRVVPTV
jgi:transposase-like protein